MHVLQVPQVLGLDARFQVYARFQAWNQFSELFTHLNIPIIADDGQLKKVLAPRKKRRIRRKQVVRRVEEIVIDRVLPAVTFELPDLNQKPTSLENDCRALILDLNGVLLCHFWEGQPIPTYTTRMKEVTYSHGQRVFVHEEASAFLLWCIENFTVFIWSCALSANVTRLLRAAFPEMATKLVGQILSQQHCEKHKGDANVLDTKKPIFYKCLSQFWKHNSKFNASNTLIVDDSVYKCFKNLRRCCLIFPKLEDVPLSEIAGFLNGNILNWLWSWLLAEDRPQYARANLMRTPLDEESLKVFHWVRGRQLQRDFVMLSQYVTNSYFKLLRPFRQLLAVFGPA